MEQITPSASLHRLWSLLGPCGGIWVYLPLKGEELASALHRLWSLLGPCGGIGVYLSLKGEEPASVFQLLQ